MMLQYGKPIVESRKDAKSGEDIPALVLCACTGLCEAFHARLDLSIL